MLVKNQKVFPWRTKNSFNLLVNGSTFYKEMLHAIEHAQSIILLETYFVESGNICTSFIHSLIAATKRGVSVYVMFDDMGSRGVNLSDRSTLVNSGIKLCFYHPVKFHLLLNNFYRDHRKLLLIDNELVFVGGAGISDKFVGKDFWRDNMLKISGQVVKDWSSLFVYNWKKQQNSSIEKFSFNSDKANKTLGKVTYSRGFFYNQIKYSLINHIEKSSTRVWLAIAYFVPSFKLRKVLRMAAKRGVDIMLMLPSENTDNNMSRYIGHGYYSKLLKSNIKIYEFQQHFIHSKVVLVDDWVTIGSSNLDRWGSNWNLEANQEIQDEDFAKLVKQMFIRDFENCTEITLEKWQKRSWQEKLMVWVWKYLGLLIAKIGLKK